MQSFAHGVQQHGADKRVRFSEKLITLINLHSVIRLLVIFTALMFIISLKQQEEIFYITTLLGNLFNCWLTQISSQPISFGVLV